MSPTEALPSVHPDEVRRRWTRRRRAAAAALVVGLASLASSGCSDSNADEPTSDEPTSDERSSADAPSDASGEFSALTYNVAGLPEGLSGSHPEVNTPQIGPLLNAFDLVLVQESWRTPEPNPTPFRTYHEILDQASTHEFSSTPLAAPLGKDAGRPTALLSDGLNQFSSFEFEPELVHTRWTNCGADAADCLALKGFTYSTITLGEGVTVDLYNLHMEAGGKDSALRAENVALLTEFIEERSDGRAVIVGGDFNLHIEEEPDGTQFEELLAAGDLADACTVVECDEPNRIDKFLFRSSDEVTITPTGWRIPDGFVDDAGEPLSDHEPVEVTFSWSATT